MESKAHAEHALLLLPARDQTARAGRVGIEAAHDGETVRMRRGGLQGEIVAITFP